MPFFNFRRSGTNSANGAAAVARPAASAEVLRKRAKHRLIGAAVLVLLGVVGFPLLFDTQPRPIAVDIPIVIPGKANVPPLSASAPVATAPAALTAASAAIASVPSPADQVVPAASLARQEEVISSKQADEPVSSMSSATKLEAKIEKKTEYKPDAKPEAKVEVRSEAKPTPKPSSKPEAKPDQAPPADDAARVQALLNGTAVPKSAAKVPAAGGEARFIVQVGAFADAVKANEARVKLERAGLKTYTQIADTKDGKRTRVRVGPFATRAEAEKATEKIKSLDLPAAILSL